MDVLLCWSCQKKLYRQTDKTLCPEKKLKKKKKKERESDVWNFPGLEEGSGNPQLKNGKVSATTAKTTAFTRTPTLKILILLLNTKRPENRGSRQIFCPTQPVRAQIFRHVRNRSQIWQRMRRIEALFWLLGTRTTASTSGVQYYYGKAQNHGHQKRYWNE